MTQDCYISLTEAAKITHYSVLGLKSMCNRKRIAFRRTPHYEVELNSLLAYSKRNTKEDLVIAWIKANPARQSFTQERIKQGMLTNGVKVSYKTISKAKLKVHPILKKREFVEKWYKDNPRRIRYSLSRVQIEMELLGVQVHYATIYKARKSILSCIKESI